MATVGERLRHERESRGRTIEEIAGATGVGIAYLEAMESGAVDALPGRAFGKLYVRAYAEVLGFDPQPLIEAYDREQRAAGAEAREPSQPAPAGARPVAAAIERWKAAREAPVQGPEPPTETVEPHGTGAETRPEPVAAVAGAAEPPLPVRRSRRSVAALLVSAAVVIAAATYLGVRRTADGPATPIPREEPRPTSSAPEPKPDASVAPAPAVTANADASPAPRRAARATSPSGALAVSEFGIGRRVVGSRLEGKDDRFTEGDAVTFQTRVLGGIGGDLVRHVWIFEGRAEQSIPLRLGGPDWRTHSTKTLYRTGAWAVEARDASGRVLARAAFVCDPRLRHDSGNAPPP